MERETAVAGRVLVAALEADAAVAEQDGAGRQHGGAVRRAVLERPLGHGRDADGAMLFLEGGIMRPGAAAEVPHLPAAAGCQQMRAHRHGWKHSNFSQAAPPASGLKRIAKGPEPC